MLGLARLHRYWLYSVISPPVWFGTKKKCKQLTHLLFRLSPRSASGLTLFFASARASASLLLLIFLHLWLAPLSLSLSLVMATTFSRVVFALQHTPSSHCPAVTRAHISTGRPAVQYWKKRKKVIVMQPMLCCLLLCWSVCSSLSLLILHVSCLPPMSLF